jgi:hypothetical protein
MSHNHLKVTQPASPENSIRPIPPRNLSVKTVLSMNPPVKVYE